ncbi:MAG: hypothetical protein WCV93_03710 [Candidatus Shapirobacteria bacterium]|jgi:hypothetical protein
MRAKKIKKKGKKMSLMDFSTIKIVGDKPMGLSEDDEIIYG